VPLYVNGDLKIVASWDLGGLGPTEGPPTVFAWGPPGLLPQFIPWLVVLLLLLLPVNRSARAWWIWAPVAAVGAVVFLPESMLGALPSEVMSALLDVIRAGTFGLAAVWLLAPHLVRKRPLGTFACVLGVMAGVGMTTAAVIQDWGDLLDTLAIPVVIAVGVAALVLALAMALAGWAHRASGSRLPVTLGLLLAVAATWIAILLPFFLVAVYSRAGRLPWLEFFGPVLVISALTFAVLVPFLVLSFASPLFGARLCALLHLTPVGPPTPAAAAPA
jgi:hypothetical protein